MGSSSVGLAIIGLAVGGLGEWAAASAEVPYAPLPEVTVTAARVAPDEVEGAISASAASVSGEQLANRPMLRSGELLEAVPGLVVTQHSGDGKANQYFLRGFNLDHGTDFATRVDGVPVNMPTHAHGQGYSDLNFLIPELIERVDYRKGVYYAEEGDFSAAGAADIRYRRSVDAPFAVLSGGQGGYRRAVLGASTSLAGGELLAGGEYGRTDGPWVLPEGYDQASALIKYTRGDEARGVRLEAIGYDGHWSATDQIPLRAVSAGRISRYGAVDPGDGGRSHRWSISGEAWGALGSGELRAGLYALDYHLDLFSDFTYFRDSLHGDQFEQYDDRHVYGAALRYERPVALFDSAGTFRAGVQLRDDHIDPVGLYDTTGRIRWRTISVSAARVSGAAVYVAQELRLAPWWRTQLGARFDSYSFDVSANLPVNSGRANASLASPKLAIVLGPWRETEYFVDAGEGFHSNDARGTTLTVDPMDGATPVSRVSPLVRARGAELGVRTSAVPRLELMASLWTLGLGSELTLDDDASAIVPSGATRRYGLELSASFHPLDSLVFDTDLAWTRARYVNGAPGGRYLPNAPQRVASAGAELNRAGGWFGGVRLRYLGATPLTPDDSVRSRASLQLSAEAGFHFSARLSAALSAFNLLDRRDYDIEYYYASQLRGEAAPVDDLHVHPVEPRSLRASLSYRFER
jgi:hypothetical protein